MKKTVVISASLKPYKYSNKAVCLLSDHKHEVVAIGAEKGKIKDIDVLTEKVTIKDVDTVTLYLSAKRQVEYYEYILGLNPKRIIMNPGAENDELRIMAENNHIEVVEHCTLIMLNMGTY